MYEFFKLIFYVEFFIFPISAGFLSYAAIKGKKKKPYLIAVVSSAIMLVVSLMGIYINSSIEQRASMRAAFEQSLGVEE